MTGRLLQRLGGRLASGGGYDPEQWDAAVCQEDDEPVRRAQANPAPAAGQAAP